VAIDRTAAPHLFRALRNPNYLGTAPIGSLITGVAAERIGAPRTIMMGGVACAIAGAWFYSSLPTLRDIVHPIYAERGLLVMPDADSGSKTL